MSADESPEEPVRVVVMGVAGSGKSTIARSLATQLGARFLEADEYHLPTSIEKMSNGIPLNDDDRWPWLITLQRLIAAEHRVVLTCSALKRSYRDILRDAGNVRFVFLDVDRAEIERRIAARTGHFMGSTMVESQFAALERPTRDETDIAIVHVERQADLQADSSNSTVKAGRELLALVHPGTATTPLLAEGGRKRIIDAEELRTLIDKTVDAQIIPQLAAAGRVLLVPPDHTRLHSRAGEITGLVFQRLVDAGCEVAVLPALGTHAEMTQDDASLMFGDAVPYDRILHHRWRDHLKRLGEISAEEVRALSSGRLVEPIPVEADEILFDGWDVVVSVGQVVPHEVIGMANFTKNIVIGLGGAPTIHRSHFLGAVSDMETIMGRPDSPVRHVVDAAFDRYFSERVNVLWILTVMEDSPVGVVQRGLFVGSGRSNESGGAAYQAAAKLAAECNVELVSIPFARVACWLDPNEFRTTWLGNKAVYRTRMAIADGGELIVLAPGVTRFGEDPAIDLLIRRHGYRGTPATVAALATDLELAASLGAAAHLVHGSSEGRFTITYCTDPQSGGLTQAEVEGVGFRWRSLTEELAHLGVDASTSAGPRVDSDSSSFVFIANPALGLWATRERFGERR